jgi:hypothetical protein
MPSIGAEMLVGETYLRQHRLWISHTSGRVYISKSRRTAEAAVPPVSAP